MADISPASWVPFWFEGNQYFDWVNSPADWNEVKRIYLASPSWLQLDQLLERSKQDPSSSKVKFGLAHECTGPKTLREFFTENGMTP